MPKIDPPKSPGLTDRLDQTAKTYTNAKTLSVAIVSAIGAIFAAGIYYNELRNTLKDYVGRIESLEAQQSSFKQQIQALSNDQSAEKKNIRDAVNDGFKQLRHINNVGTPFRNTEPANNGGGNSPASPPGRCQADGQIVVGVAPFKESNGIRSIDMQCGLIPEVKIK